MFLDGQAVGPGLKPVWEDADTVVADTGTTLYEYRRASAGRRRLQRGPGAYARYAAGGGRFVGEVHHAGQRATVVTAGEPMRLGYGPFVAPDGRWGYLTHADTLIFDGAGVDGGPIRDVRASRQHLVYVREDERYQPKVWAWRRGEARPSRAHASWDACFGPVPIELPDGTLWIAAYTNAQIVVYPASDAQGYVVDAQSPSTEMLDAAWVDGAIRLVWTGQDGRLRDQRIAIDAPRVDLRVNPSLEEDRSGQPLDMLDYFFGRGDGTPRTGSHPIQITRHDRERWAIITKFGRAQDIECYRWDDQWIYHHFDRTNREFEPHGYYFTDGRWLRRFMRVGDRIEVSQNWKVSLEAGCQDGPRRRFPYTMELLRRHPHFDCGGDLGVQDVIVVKYDPRPVVPEGDRRPGGYELGYHARDLGVVAWEGWKQP